ncbi:MAG: hypothetical protein ACD_76C00117G0001 [uncultured bacterium]|nr:MAG: hypothetical protein ACD_76C00117G0001 [uncultured bacterium]HBD05066.1 hypothetical protein [Candidatus Uhrbacteria bacterium]
MKPTVAVIYVSYNARPFLDDAVFSLENMNYAKDSVELVIIDNASGDDSAQYLESKLVPRLRNQFKHVAFFPNLYNSGFAGGYNQGMRYALEREVDYVYLLNADAKVAPDFLDRVVDVCEQDAKIGAAQSAMLLAQEPDKINSSGNMIHFLGFGFSRDSRESADMLSRYCDGDEIAYASGAAVLLRVRALREVGLFLEELFMYHEDLDLGLRMRIAGWKSVIAPSSVAYHHYEFSRSIKKFYFMERNRIAILLIHLRITTLLLIAPAFFAMELGILFFSIRSGWFMTKLFSYAGLLKPSFIKIILENRKRSFGLRTISDREATRLFCGSIMYQEIKNPLLEFVANPVFNLYWKIIRNLII